MRRFRRPSWPGCSCCVWLALLLGGCGSGADEASPGPVTVTVLDPAHEVIFNPVWDMPAKFLLFSPLVGHDEKGEYEPRLARAWEASPDGRVWTYHLRTDVLWHDGVPFTHRRIRGLSSPFRARTLMHMEHAWVEKR